jgi:hypothetical protein
VCNAALFIAVVYYSTVLSVARPALPRLTSLTPVESPNFPSQITRRDFLGTLTANDGKRTAVKA